jgi:hypothetical protein
MTWWAWSLVFWAMLASVGVIALSVKLWLAIEWREQFDTANEVWSSPLQAG